MKLTKEQIEQLDECKAKINALEEQMTSIVEEQAKSMNVDYFVTLELIFKTR